MARPVVRSAAAWTTLLVVWVGLHIGLGLFTGYDEVWNTGGDVVLYDYWVDQWLRTGVLVGVGADWVYPVLALVPIIGAAALGTDTTAYYTVWMLIVLALDLVALVLLARRRMALAWWWVAFSALLGPVVFARLDAIAIAVAIPGVLLAATRPAVASALFTVAAWIKIWPAALVLALVLAVRRAGRVIAAAAGVTVAVVAVALSCGAGPHLLSFVTGQTGRGIQVEAPVALPWLWAQAVSGGDSLVYYDETLFTWQLRGPGTAQTAALMTPVLALAVLAVVVAAVVARRRGAVGGPVLAAAALGLVSALIALNKVGSPQYMTWLVAPVLLGLLADPPRFRFPAVLVLVAAGLTQAIYPYLYFGLTSPNPWVVGVITVRNLLEVVLFGWALAELLRARARPPLARPETHLASTSA